jgi:hypothetical protein
MFYTTHAKKLAMAATGAALIALGIDIAPANAITFEFTGEAEETVIEGRYTVDDDVFNELASDGPFQAVNDAVTFFSLSANGNNLFSGVPTNSRLERTQVTNGILFGSSLVVEVSNFGFNLGLLRSVNGGSLSECAEKVCEGKALITGLELFVPVVTQRPVTETVPEPATAIALGAIGASALFTRRRKASDSQGA